MLIVEFCVLVSISKVPTELFIVLILGIDCNSIPSDNEI